MHHDARRILRPTIRVPAYAVAEGDELLFRTPAYRAIGRDIAIPVRRQGIKPLPSLSVLPPWLVTGTAFSLCARPYELIAALPLSGPESPARRLGRLTYMRDLLCTMLAFAEEDEAEEEAAVSAVALLSFCCRSCSAVLGRPFFWEKEHLPPADLCIPAWQGGLFAALGMLLPGFLPGRPVCAAAVRRGPRILFSLSAPRQPENVFLSRFATAIGEKRGFCLFLSPSGACFSLPLSGAEADDFSLLSRKEEYVAILKCAAALFLS